MKKLLVLPLLALFLYFIYFANPAGRLPPGTKIEKLVVQKSKRQLLVYAKGKLVKTYAISLGSQPVSDKQYQCDNKTPEGVYTINDKNPNSKYRKNLGVSYPNAVDRREAARMGKPVGGDIKIHGLPHKISFIRKWHRLYDWTAGCIAVTNAEIEELYKAVPLGTPIEIQP